MSEFRKYQSLAKLNNKEVEGIFTGICHVFPKLDGTNASVWADKKGIIHCGSRNKEITPQDDNRGFAAYIKSQPETTGIKALLEDYPMLTLVGEWLVPHVFKGYKKDAWNNFYVFDVITRDGLYLTYEEYSSLLKDYAILYIPFLRITEDLKEADIQQVDLKTNNYLCQEGMGPGEGVVIKNYKFINQFGRVTWAKVLSDEFLNKKNALPKRETIRNMDIEEKIVELGVTLSLLDKEKAKIEKFDEDAKNIAKLMGTVYYCLLTEELPSIIFKLKLPEVDFNVLKKTSDQKVRKYLGL